MGNERIFAVIVTYHPDADFATRLTRVSTQVGGAVVVDNSTDHEARERVEIICRTAGVELIQNAENLGIGAALNQGLGRARAAGFAWALTLDQDSEPADDMVTRLWKGLERETAVGTIAQVAPRVIEASVGKEARFLRSRGRFLFRLATCRGERPMVVTTAISSGSLLNAQIHDALGGFREDFFMDYVDTEYCLRARLFGYRTIAVCGAKLFHHLGHRGRVDLGPFTLYPTFYPSWRWYTLSRNRIAMLRLYGLRVPHWFLYEILASTFITLRMLATETRRLDKVNAMFRGTWDGVRGSMSLAPANDR